MKRIIILLVSVLIHNFTYSQDTTVTWLRNIDTMSFKKFYTKNDIPKESYKYIGIKNKNEIVNPTDSWYPSCIGKIHYGLNWIAKDKFNHYVICFTHSCKGICNVYI